MGNKKRKSDCPIYTALDVFGDKWTLLIVRDLMFTGKHHYGDFLRMEETIATNILADRLFLLEEAGIISKTIDESNKSKKIYSLSQKGIDLLPMLIEIILWSAKYDKHSASDPKFVRQGIKDRDGLMARIKADFK